MLIKIIKQQSGHFWNRIIRCLLIGILIAISAAEVKDASDCDVYNASDSGHRCYIVVNEITDWNEANEKCETMGGHIVTITTEEELTLVTNIMTSHNMLYIWLGAMEMPDTWKWLDGRDIFYQGCFKDDSSDPDFDNHRLNSDNSYEVCEYQCRKKGDPYGALQDGDVCWCGQSFGKYGYSTDCNKPCPVDQSQTCGGKQANDVFVVDGTYSNWGTGLPNNHLNYQTCAEIETGNKFLWNDAKCTEYRGFICEIDNRTICTDNDSLILQNPDSNSTSCYFISTDTLSWFQARHFCYRLGGDLLIIDDPVIDKMLLDQFSTMNFTGAQYISGFWFGLTRSPWKWQSGEDFIFTSWSSGEPNGHQQHCITMSQSGEWKDNECSDVLKTICEIDTTLPSSPETTTPPTSTTTRSTTTTLKLAPVRMNGRVASFEIDDRHLAAIVAGGVVMLIIILVVVTVHCHYECKKHAKRKEEKKDEKREKYFFGFDSGTVDNETGISDNNDTLGQDKKSYENIDDKDLLNEETTVVREDNTSDNKEGRLSGLSDKPDLIPQEDT